MGATQNSSYNLTRFGLPEMVACSAVLRQLDKGAQSLEEVAQRSVNWLYEHLTDDDGQRACALVRLFQTRPASALSTDLLRAAGLAAPPPPIPCLVLLATAGEQPGWNAPNTSAHHRAIALKSAEAVADAPMIAQLLRQFGVNIPALMNPTPELFMEHGAHTFNVFYVAEAAGSPWVPVQAEFVLRYGIQSVLGFGGVLPDGSLFATILFSRAAISPATAEQFRTLALSLKLALLPFTPVAV
jgi:hypothetical protein